LALPALLYGCEIWAIRGEDKYRITSAEMIFMRRMTKCARQDYKTNEDNVTELKIKTVVKKIQNYGSKWIQHVRQIDRNRKTDRPTDCHTQL